MNWQSDLSGNRGDPGPSIRPRDQPEILRPRPSSQQYRGDELTDPSHRVLQIVAPGHYPVVVSSSYPACAVPPATRYTIPRPPALYPLLVPGVPIGGPPSLPQTMTLPVLPPPPPLKHRPPSRQRPQNTSSASPATNPAPRTTPDLTHHNNSSRSSTTDPASSSPAFSSPQDPGLIPDLLDLAAEGLSVHSLVASDEVLSPPLSPSVTTGQRYSCSKCNYSTARHDKILEHINAHNGRYICSVCDKAFIKQCDLQRHCKQKHGFGSVEEPEEAVFRVLRRPVPPEESSPAHSSDKITRFVDIATRLNDVLSAGATPESARNLLIAGLHQDPDPPSTDGAGATHSTKGKHIRSSTDTSSPGESVAENRGLGAVSRPDPRTQAAQSDDDSRQDPLTEQDCLSGRQSEPLVALPEYTPAADGVVDVTQYDTPTDPSSCRKTHSPVKNTTVNVPNGFRCHLCNYEGRSEKSLQKHLRAHDQIYKICRYCDKAFERPSDLVRHEERHEMNMAKTGGNPSLISKGKILGSEHSEPKPQPEMEFLCKKCGFVTDRYHKLALHNRQRHSTKHVCKFCGMTFISPLPLSNHMKRCQKKDSDQPPADQTSGCNKTEDSRNDASQNEAPVKGIGRLDDFRKDILQGTKLVNIEMEAENDISLTFHSINIDDSDASKIPHCCKHTDLKRIILTGQNVLQAQNYQQFNITNLSKQQLSPDTMDTLAASTASDTKQSPQTTPPKSSPILEAALTKSMDVAMRQTGLSAPPATPESDVTTTPLAPLSLRLPSPEEDREPLHTGAVGPVTTNVSASPIDTPTNKARPLETEPASNSKGIATTISATTTSDPSSAPGITTEPGPSIVIKVTHPDRTSSATQPLDTPVLFGELTNILIPAQQAGPETQHTKTPAVIPSLKREADSPGAIHHSQQLLRPNAIRHKQTNFYCQRCNYGTDTKGKMDEHLRAHKGRFVCKHCDKACIKASDLYRHWVTHNLRAPNGDMICDSCDFTSPDRLVIENHLRVHYTLRFNPLAQSHNITKCGLCGKQFTRSQLFIHKKMAHSSEGRAQTSAAARVRAARGWTSRRGKVIQLGQNTDHLMVHSRPQSSSDAAELTSHPNKKHSGSPEPTRVKTEPSSHTTCEYCHRKFDTPHQLYGHVRVHYRQKIRPPTSSNQRNTVGKYPCRYCHKRFRNKYYCVNHERLHTGERPYACSKCGQRFALSQACQIHESRNCPERRDRRHLVVSTAGTDDSSEEREGEGAGRLELMEAGREESEKVTAMLPPSLILQNSDDTELLGQPTKRSENNLASSPGSNHSEG